MACSTPGWTARLPEIDLFEGDKVNASALGELIRAAVALNVSGKKK
jgi:hypothetical protein